VDGQRDEKGIVDCFAKVFSSTCTPNSEAKHAELGRRFRSRFAQYDNTDICTNRISFEILEACIAELKKGKAPGCDGLTAEHMLHAHPILNVLLSLLFNMIYMYGVVSDTFVVGIAIPLVKNMDGNRTSCDNYRCITLSPVISKLFELTLFRLFGTQLQSDNLQYAFKCNAVAAKLFSQ